MAARPCRGALRRRRLLWRGLLVLVAAAAVAAAAAPPALGHAAFLESTPPPGARLESSPPQLKLEFTEPLNRKLTTATLVDLASGKRIATQAEQAEGKELVLRIPALLETAPYRVKWHTVSTQDGHPLEGSFSFGVRTAAAGGSHQLEQSPLARGGWLRIALRGMFYAALFFFAGGLLGAALLSPRAHPAGWLVPAAVHPSLRRAGEDPQSMPDRVWRRTLDAGWLAVAYAIAIAIVEAADAADGLSLQKLNDFLLSNTAGLGRVGTVLALMFAVVQGSRLRFLASAWTALAFLSIAISGHANSADPRGLALLTDWTHLLAAAVWIGGIAQVASVWVRLAQTSGGELRSAAMRSVLDRFGKLALPAFLLVASTGVTNALIQLGHVNELWESGYGRVLAVKVTLVGLIALASYWHALRLRPRVLAANPHPAERLERRHWRLLGVEPLLAIGVVLAAGVLVAFPLPPRQLTETDEAEAAQADEACNPCPLRKPAANELAVAEQAGSSIAAVWVRYEGRRLVGEVRLLDPNEKAVAAKAQLPQAEEQKSCGPGCWRFRLADRPRTLELRVPEKGKLYTARLPVAWLPAGNGRARKLLERAQETMRALRSVRENERITSGPGSFAETNYRLEAPDRFAYVTNRRTRTVTVGKYQWFRSGDSAWHKQLYGGGPPPFRTRSWFRWTSYAQAVRLLGVKRQNGRRILELALMDRGTPVWFRLRIDQRTMRVLRVRMIAGGHFMNQRFHAFNQPLTIEPPKSNAR